MAKINLPHFTLIDAGNGHLKSSFRPDVLGGLTKRPKSIPSHHLYDHEGSLLFEAICRLPEYYLTRAERSILEERAGEIAGRFATEVEMLELGSGSSRKTRLLIEGFLSRHGSVRYTPVDINPKVLENSARTLLKDYPSLKVRAIAGDYEHGLRYVGAENRQPRLIVWLGSSIGNFSRSEGARFLRMVRDTMKAEDRLLVGIDLRKDPKILKKAYDDSQGITARFNRNILGRINRELGGEFDVETFDHQAIYNEKEGCVEMHLVSRSRQTVTIRRLETRISFDEGESIHTENSHKYSLAEILELVRNAGFHLEHQWHDAQKQFTSNLLAPQV